MDHRLENVRHWSNVWHLRRTYILTDILCFSLGERVQQKRRLASECHSFQYRVDYFSELKYNWNVFLIFFTEYNCGFTTTFRRNLLLPLSGRSNLVVDDEVILLRWVDYIGRSTWTKFHYCQSGGSTFLRNADVSPQSYTVLNPARPPV
jgi:hypothetical protein